MEIGVETEHQALLNEHRQLLSVHRALQRVEVSRQLRAQHAARLRTFAVRLLRHVDRLKRLPPELPRPNDPRASS